jgi:hypothetical protein
LPSGCIRCMYCANCHSDNTYVLENWREASCLKK